MLKVYQAFAEEVLAMPVLAGQKSESEKFAGALRTYSIEAMMQDKKALQAGTSHNLASNFAQAFQTSFLDKDGQQKWVHQTSWGVSTRLIGGMIMTHSDDRGLVLPPRLASTHVVIVPILSQAAAKASVLQSAHGLLRDLQQAAQGSDLPYSLGVHVDEDETKQPGWKFHEYELLGIPLRIEIGPRDLEKGQAVLTRRDTSTKEFIPLAQIPHRVISLLKTIQDELLEKARRFRDQNTHRVSTYAEFKEKLDSQGGFFMAPWCQSAACESRVKEETKATIRCLPLDDAFQSRREQGGCMVCAQAGPSVCAVFARSY
jgi:prolyl-tRNA synthetase